MYTVQNKDMALFRTPCIRVYQLMFLYGGYSKPVKEQTLHVPMSAEGLSGRGERIIILLQNLAAMALLEALVGSHWANISLYVIVSSNNTDPA
jgi:hypothetical protein